MLDREVKITELIAVCKPKEWNLRKGDFLMISDERLDSIVFFAKNALTLEQAILLSIHAVEMTRLTSMDLDTVNGNIIDVIRTFNNTL